MDNSTGCKIADALNNIASALYELNSSFTTKEVGEALDGLASLPSVISDLEITLVREENGDD